MASWGKSCFFIICFVLFSGFYIWYFLTAHLPHSLFTKTCITFSTSIPESEPLKFGALHVISSYFFSIYLEGRGSHPGHNKPMPLKLASDIKVCTRVDFPVDSILLLGMISRDLSGATSIYSYHGMVYP